MRKSLACSPTHNESLRSSVVIILFQVREKNMIALFALLLGFQSDTTPWILEHVATWLNVWLL